MQRIGPIRRKDFLYGFRQTGLEGTSKRLRTHGLVKKTAHSYKYYLTPLGREVIATGLRLKEFVIFAELRKEAA